MALLLVSAGTSGELVGCVDPKQVGSLDAGAQQGRLVATVWLRSLGRCEQNVVRPVQATKDAGGEKEAASQ